MLFGSFSLERLFELSECGDETIFDIQYMYGNFCLLYGSIIDSYLSFLIP